MSYPDDRAELTDGPELDDIPCRTSNDATWRVEHMRPAGRAWERRPTPRCSCATAICSPSRVPVHDHPYGSVTAETLDFARPEQLDIWAYTRSAHQRQLPAARSLAEAYHHRGTARRLTALDADAAELDTTRHQVVPS